MAQKTKKVEETELIPLDLSSSPSHSIIEDEFKRIGKVEIVDVQTGNFKADVTGQWGTYAYKVQGESVVYTFGADEICKLLLAIDEKSPVVSASTLAKMQGEFKSHYSKLVNALKRQVTKAQKTE